MEALTKCVSCGSAGPFEAAFEDVSVRVGERTFTGPVGAKRCQNCGETYTDASGHVALSRRVALALIDAGDVSGPTFRFFRHTLGLTGAALASLLGVAPDTVSRWERGERGVDPLAWVTVAGLVLDELEDRPSTRRVLEAVQSGPPLAKAVRLEPALPASSR